MLCLMLLPLQFKMKKLTQPRRQSKCMAMKMLKFDFLLSLIVWSQLDVNNIKVTFMEQTGILTLNLCGTVLAITLMLCGFFLSRQQRKDHILFIKSKARPLSTALHNSEWLSELRKLRKPFSLHSSLMLLKAVLEHVSS